MRVMAGKILGNSVFAKTGADGFIHWAVLVNLDGEAVVLCGKEFLRDLPAGSVSFANGRGRVVCSKIFVSKESPVVIALPDAVPEGLTPMEVFPLGDISDPMVKNLYMLTPDGGSFLGKEVSVFSIGDLYLNLATPKGRDLRMESGGNSIVVDPKSGKLVSITIEVCEPGRVSFKGKRMDDPNTSIASFFKDFYGIEYFPAKSVKFVRLTSLKDRTPVTLEELKSQEEKIRKFAKKNNEFLTAFYTSSFSNAVPPFKTIIDRYRKPLMHDRLDKSLFERYCRNLAIEIQLAAKHMLDDAGNIGNLCPIYRDEMDCHMAVRRQTYDYITDVIRNGNVMEIMPQPLRRRYR